MCRLDSPRSGWLAYRRQATMPYDTNRVRNIVIPPVYMSEGRQCQNVLVHREFVTIWYRFSLFCMRVRYVVSNGGAIFHNLSSKITV